MILGLVIGLLAVGNNVRGQGEDSGADSWCNLHALINFSLAPGLYFNLSGTVYLPGATIPITDVGDSYFPGGITNHGPGPSLVCVTRNVNTMCYGGAGNGSVRNWYYPNGTDTIVLGNNVNPDGDFTRSSHTQQIRFNRKRPDVMSPTGVYNCEVPDGSNTAIIHRATITLGECKESFCDFTIIIIRSRTAGSNDHWCWRWCVYSWNISLAQPVEVHP